MNSNRSKINFRKFFPWLNQYSSLLVAIATLMLAFLTYNHIRVTKEMAVETKRLADISVEQFKIKSYPTFLVSIGNIKFKSDILFHKITFTNKGDITAHKVSFLPITIYQKESKALYETQRLVYKGPEKEINAAEFEVKILKNSGKELFLNIKSPNGYSFKDLRYLLIFIKFKVPYDENLSYEVLGYYCTHIIEPGKEGTPFWSPVTTDQRINLIANFYETFKELNQYAKLFLRDYMPEAPIK